MRRDHPLQARLRELLSSKVDQDVLHDYTYALQTFKQEIEDNVMRLSNTLLEDVQSGKLSTAIQYVQGLSYIVTLHDILTMVVQVGIFDEYSFSTIINSVEYSIEEARELIAVESNIDTQTSLTHRVVMLTIVSKETEYHRRSLLRKQSTPPVMNVIDFKKAVTTMIDRAEYTRTILN